MLARDSVGCGTQCLVEIGVVKDRWTQASTLLNGTGSDGEFAIVGHRLS
jgi:hypothetical protein